MNKGANFLFCTTKAQKSYHEIQYSEDCFLLFGRETKGLPESLLSDNYEKCIRIPMLEKIRSLNLSNSAAVVLYEVLRQRGFKDMQVRGHLE